MPAADSSEKPTPHTAGEMQGRHYQHRLPRIASTTFAGDEQIDGIQTSKDGSRGSLERTVAHTPLPAVDHSETKPSTCDNNEISSENRVAIHSANNHLEQHTNLDYFKDLTITCSDLDLTTITHDPGRHTGRSQSISEHERQIARPKISPETQDEKHGSTVIINDGSDQNYSGHNISHEDSMDTSRSKRRVSVESDLYAASIQYHPQAPQIQDLSDSEGEESFKGSRIPSLKSPTNDDASSSLYAPADSRIIRTPDSLRKDRMIHGDANTSDSSTKTRSIDNPFAHSVSALETATTMSYNSHSSFGSINISNEKEVVSPPAWMNSSLNGLSPQVTDPLTPPPEANYLGEQGRVMVPSDPPLSGSLNTGTSPQTNSLVAERGQSLPQPSITLRPPADSLQLPPVEGMAAERQRAQAKLSRLQHELAEAKSRGDKKSAQSSLEESIKLIQDTYLVRETSLESKQALVDTKSAPRRKHILRLPSLASLTQIPMRIKTSQITAAVEAACSGNDTKLKELLDQGISVNARSGDSKTLFGQAAMHGHIDCMALLKERGADELAVDHKGLNALHSAVLARQTATVEWLLKSFPSNEENELHMTPSKTNKSSIRSMLVSSRSLRETSDRAGFRPLHLAARHGVADVLNILLRDGADLEAKCNRGGTPLHQAVISSHPQIIREMLAKGADLTAADASGLTPLHRAAASSEVDVVNILLSAGSDRSTYDNSGNMPIHLAVGKGHLAAVKVLSRDLPDLEVKTASGDSLLHIAVLMNHLQVVEYLLQNKVHVNPWSKSPPAKLDNGRVVFAKTIRHAPSSTPLHSACFAGQYEISALLLDHEAWSNAATADDKTPLMLAVESDDTNLVYLLLARKAKVDAKIPKSFLTAQHMAAQMGNLETLQVLYQHGASLDALTSDNKAPFCYAYKCKDPTKQAAVLEWLHKIRLRKAAQARELSKFRKPRDTIAPTSQQYYAPTTTTTSPQVSYQDSTALIRQLSPAYHGFDQVYDTFPEAPPPYVAGPLAPATLVRRDPVYRPPPGV